MARPNWSAEARAAQSKRMKARWKLARHLPTEPVMNGHIVEQRIVLNIQNQCFDLTLEQAEVLRDALTQMLPTRAPHADVHSPKEPIV